MRPVLLDTNAYTAFKRGDENIIEIITRTATIGMSPIVLGELLGGFDSGSKSHKNREELHQFLASPRIRIFPLGLQTANFFALVYSKLKSKGKPIPTNDMWIAAQALEHGCLVCSLDRHFSNIDGLIVGSTMATLSL
jgi:tRNA(fMet)-specific endonuclease VapC